MFWFLLSPIWPILSQVSKIKSYKPKWIIAIHFVYFSVQHRDSTKKYQSVLRVASQQILHMNKLSYCESNYSNYLSWFNLTNQNCIPQLYFSWLVFSCDAYQSGRHQCRHFKSRFLCAVKTLVLKFCARKSANISQKNHLMCVKHEEKTFKGHPGKLRP